MLPPLLPPTGQADLLRSMSQSAKEVRHLLAIPGRHLRSEMALACARQLQRLPLRTRQKPWKRDAACEREKVKQAREKVRERVREGERELERQSEWREWEQGRRGGRETRSRRLDPGTQTQTHASQARDACAHRRRSWERESRSQTVRPQRLRQPQLLLLLAFTRKAGNA